MKIALGSDHAGFKLKEALKNFLLGKGYRVKDFGTFSQERCDYPDFGYKVAKAVASGKFERGILICATGIGQSIVANRFPGVRAALCYNLKSAKLSREHNDANVITLGARFMNEEKAKRAILLWLNTEFQGGRHLRRIKKIEKMEKKILRREE
ncbi:MAG: ribose 5-phosphate isomerase B [Candidatus Omnitrophica bacterium]|nr:ribose 5-phosphate isomerase B [Candidatus Omnitrophota bacterium]MCM8793507.1 ribose 5-phosphate isomerase B [Candidatus Omnitrophota bacterium]